MINRRDIQDAVKVSQARNSQNMQWIGQVVSADTTGGLCLLNVRGKIISCVVPEGAQITYGVQVSVSRMPGQARLVVNAGGNTTVINQVAAPIAAQGGAVGEAPSIMPDIPQELVATALSETEIYLEWSSTGLNTVDYLIERSLTDDPDGFAWIATTTVEETVYSDTELTGATQYWYRVRAQNKDNVSAYSNIATATTLGAFPIMDLLDDFGRENTYHPGNLPDPLGSAWGNYDGRVLTIEDDQCSDGHHYYSNGWNIWLTSYAPDCAVSITITNWGFTETSSVELGFTNEFRNPDPAGSSAHYLEDYGLYVVASNIKDGNGHVSLTLNVHGVGSPVYHITDPQNGDEIGIAIADGVVTVGYKAVGGSWIAALTSAATSPYPFETTMYPWIRMSGLSVHPMRIDKFCGGAI